MLARFADQRAGFDVGQAVVVEVAADAAAQILGLADVDDRAVGVLVEVHAGQGRQLGGFVAKVGQRIYNLIVSRALAVKVWVKVCAAYMLSLPLWAQQPAAAPPSTPPSSPQPRPQAQPQEEEPPEEDQSFKPSTYDFNPLQGLEEHRRRRLSTSRRADCAAAKGRYKDATLYDPGSAEAFEKLGEVSEKLRDFAAARDAYSKYLELAPTAKDAEAIKKRMEKFPASPRSPPRNDR